MGEMKVERPKSVAFIVATSAKGRSNRKFSGLRSRWITPNECMCLITCSITRTRSAACFSLVKRARKGGRASEKGMERAEEGSKGRKEANDIAENPHL